MKLRTWFMVLLASSMIIGLNGFYEPVTAIVDGEYYVCNFEAWAVGTENLTEYIGGEEWLRIENEYNVIGVQGTTNKNYSMVNLNDNINSLAWFNLSQNTDFIAYYINCDSTEFNNIWHFHQYFYRSDGQQLFHIDLRDTNSGGLYAFDIYDEDDILVHTGSDQVAAPSWVNATMYTNNDTYFINISAYGTYWDYWHTPGNFDYIADIKMYFVDGVGVGRYIHIDDFKIDGDESSLPILWDNGDDYVGCADCTYLGNKTHSFADSNTFVDEIEYNTFTPGERITQVVLAVSSDSDLASISSYLRIGDEYSSSRTTYYTYGLDYYMIVWENINLTWNLGSVPLEFKFIDATTTHNIILYFDDVDVDGDGDRQFRFTEDDSNWNGTYDGDTIFSKDLCYELYYDTGYETGDVTINVYNESNPSESIVNWSINIVDKITGLVYYSADDQTNPLVVNTSEYGLGPRLFYINATGYYSRTYYANIESGVNYTLDAYLPPITDAQFYWLQVIGPSNAYGVDPPIYDAQIEIARYLNETTGWIGLGTYHTNINGMAYVYMIPGVIHSFNISASGFNDYNTSFEIASNEDGYTFRLSTTGSGELVYPNITDFGSNIVFEGYISGSTFYVNYTDTDFNTTDTTIYCYEWDTGNDTLTQFGSADTRYGECNFQVTFTSIDSDNCYQAVLFLNHSKYGFHRLSFMVCANQTGRDITSKTVWDTLFDNNYGGNPFGWSNTFAFFVMIASCFSFGQRNSGVGMMLTGGVLLFVNYIIGLHIMGVMIPFIFITLGIVVQWSNHRREN